MQRRLVLCLALLCFTQSCRVNELPPPTVAGPAAVLMPHLEEVPLPPLPEGLELRPHNLAMTSSGNIAIWVTGDRTAWIRTLDSTGKIVAKWGSMGQGPGELNPADILISSDSVFGAVGANSEPVRIFGLDGSLLVQKPSPPIGWPGTLENGAILWWTAKYQGRGPRSATMEAHRDGPVVLWCVFTPCQKEFLPEDDSIVQSINRHAPPPNTGLWPAFASRGDIVILGEGYGYRLWRISLVGDPTPVPFGRSLPPRMASAAEYAKSDSEWQKLERTGIRGPGGRVIRQSFDEERKFLRETPLPHFQYMGLAFDDRGRLWSIGRETGRSMFADVFADTAFLGRQQIACDRVGFAAVVRGHWLAAICQGPAEADERFVLRLFRIVDPDSGIESPIAP